MHAKIQRIIEEAPGIKTIWFKPERPLQYNAGQYIQVTIPHSSPDNRDNTRWFTLSSSPTESLLSITTRFSVKKPSSFKRHLSKLKIGDNLEFSEPMGDFVLPINPSTPLIFIAVGIGITPMRSMIKWLLDNSQKRDIRLIYAVKNISDAVFLNLFREYGLDVDLLPESSPKRWEGKSGLLTTEKLLTLISGRGDNPYFYLSGYETMVEALAQGLEASGISSECIVVDYFHGYKDI
ncbi:hypothetical protein BH23PAT1_BH23PAT1_2480 [soil metagenome]